MGYIVEGHVRRGIIKCRRTRALGRGGCWAREIRAAGVGILAGHFSAGRGEQERVFGREHGRMFFCKCLAGVGGV
jgi:hypothetical protein